MDPHFVWPWVQLTHRIDLSLAGSNFSYRYLVSWRLVTTLQQRSLFSTWTALLQSVACGLDWRGPCHHVEGYNRCWIVDKFHKSLSKNYSFSQKVSIWENEISQEQHNEQKSPPHCWWRVENTYTHICSVSSNIKMTLWLLVLKYKLALPCKEIECLSQNEMSTWGHASVN